MLSERKFTRLLVLTEKAIKSENDQMSECILTNSSMHSPSPQPEECSTALDWSPEAYRSASPEFPSPPLVCTPPSSLPSPILQDPSMYKTPPLSPPLSSYFSSASVLSAPELYHRMAPPSSDLLSADYSSLIITSISTAPLSRPISCVNPQCTSKLVYVNVYVALCT